MAQLKLMGAILLGTDPAVGRVRVSGTPEAPGILRNPVPVRALFDREGMFPLMLRSFLQRQGRVEGLREGELIGLRQSLLVTIEARGFVLDAENLRRLEDCRDAALLLAWHRRAISATSPAAIFAE